MPVSALIAPPLFVWRDILSAGASCSLPVSTCRTVTADSAMRCVAFAREPPAPRQSPSYPEQAGAMPRQKRPQN
jgi:hypothetical protein